MGHNGVVSKALGLTGKPTMEGIMPEAKKAVNKESKAKSPKVENPKVALPKVDKTKVYEVTGQYNPKAAHNVASLAAVDKVCPALYDDIAKAIPEHIDFIGYLIRRGGLA